MKSSFVSIISIHAPTRGATVRAFIFTWIIVFQSTLPREERHPTPEPEPKPEPISIHAPTRGATLSSGMCLMALVFQSTLPREERRYKSFASKDNAISIHAPTRGATMSMCKYIHIFPFQSTLPREERLQLELKAFQYSYFNPRSHERSDTYHIIHNNSFPISIHAPTRGATLIDVSCFSF